MEKVFPVISLSGLIILYPLIVFTFISELFFKYILSWLCSEGLNSSGIFSIEFQSCLCSIFALLDNSLVNSLIDIPFILLHSIFPKSSNLKYGSSFSIPIVIFSLFPNVITRSDFHK